MKRIFVRIIYIYLIIYILTACASEKSSLNGDAHPIPAIAGVSGSTWYETYGEDKDGKPLNWIVLEQDNNKLFLLSRYALEEKIFDEISIKEKDLLLTASDVDKYLKAEDKRVATDKYGKKQNWWLSSTEENTNNKIYVDIDGNIKTYESGSKVVVYYRPAKWIDIGAKESKVLINKVDISDIEDGKVYQDIQYSQIIYKNNSKLQKSLDVLNEKLKNEAEKFKNDNKDAIREYLPDYIKFMGTDGEDAKYVYDSDISVSFKNDNYISLTTSTYEFLLGAHGGTILKGYTYDKETGEILTLDDFIKDREELKEFVKEWIKRESENDDIFFPEAMDTVDTLLSENGSIEYCLNNIGLSIIFQQYDIAPYAYGIIEIPVDKQLLKDNLKY